jgi:four helix bundle protein
MASMTFTELKVWQRAHAPVLEIYRISTSFPQEEPFGVTSQLRRAITSVATNIAEARQTADLDEVARMLHGLRSKVDRA